MKTILFDRQRPILKFNYTNYKGVTAPRRARVDGVSYKSSEWHPEPQWLMTAFDFDKSELREFAMKDMTDVVTEEVGSG